MAFVRKLVTWSEVEAVTVDAATCIRPEGLNWKKAKQVWDIFAPDDCQYFAPADRQSKSYIRVLLCGHAGTNKQYMVDYAHGDNKYLMIVEAARLLDGALICGDFYSPDSGIRERWPVIVVSLPGMARYPYHARLGAESVWRVVR